MIPFFKNTLLILITSGLSVLVATPASAERGETVFTTLNGAVIFEKSCADCHGQDGRGSELATLLSPAVQDLLAPPYRHGSDREALIRVIRDGLGTSMLGFRTRLPQQHIHAVADYVLKLRAESAQTAVGTDKTAELPMTEGVASGTGNENPQNPGS